MPITAEVGGEGGSFADATMQEGTDDDVKGSRGIPRKDRPAGAGDAAGEASHRDQVAEGGVGTDPGPGDGMKRFPTE
ncbi:MAG TPA: hypothetical protein VFX12_07060 [Vicinamibacterales bacterium]|nr:hypothetical protein [Vicinamibacterales bacterium]